MATKAEVKKWLDIIVERVNDIGPFVCADWGGSVQFIFTDLKTGWFLQLKKDGSVESLVEKIDEASATSTCEMSSDTFLRIYKKEASAGELYFSGEMQCRGSLDGMMKVMAPTVE